MCRAFILILGLVIHQRYSNGIDDIYLSRNICKIDGSNVNTQYAISVLYSRSVLNCVTSCFQHSQCVSVIFDKSTHYCQMNSQLLSIVDTSSCGELTYLQLYTETSPSSLCCSANGNYNSIVTTPDTSIEQTTSRQTFTLLPSVGISIFIGPGAQNELVARADCNQIGGELVKLDTAEKHEAVKQYIIDTVPNEEQFYIGLFKKNVFGWKWADGTNLNYARWSGPPGLLSACVVMDMVYDYDWVGTGCWGNVPYICEQI